MYKRNDNETVFIEYIICPDKVGVVAVHALGPTGVTQRAHIIALIILSFRRRRHTDYGSVLDIRKNPNVRVGVGVGLFNDAI